MYSRKKIAVIILVGFFASTIVAFINGNIYLTQFSDYSDDSEYYNTRALSLVNEGTLHEEIALFRRPPAYSFFLAAVYIILGESPVSAWVFQIIIFSFSIWMLYLICIVLNMKLPLLPPLILALYWGANFYVYKIGSDALAMFLVIGIVYIFFKYRTDKKSTLLLVFGVLFGLLSLTKPIALYLAPFIAVYLLKSHWKEGFAVWTKKIAISMILFFVIVGGWAVRTFIMFGELQAERSGHIIYTRSLYGGLSIVEIKNHFITSITGDYVSGIILDEYPTNPVHSRLGAVTKEKLKSLKSSGYSDVEAEKFLLKKALDNIRRSPVRYMAGAIPLLFELNTPENINGFPVSRMFVGTRTSLDMLNKAIIAVGVRASWYVFLLIALVLSIRHIYKRYDVGVIVIFIIFFNASHASLVMPVEPRFIVPVLPLYFILFAFGVEYLLRARNNSETKER